MRELKYRVWTGEKMWTHWNPSTFWQCCEENEWHEIMQYTGLKDKNGREIWEGDLIRAPHVISPAQIMWGDSCYGWAINDDWAIHEYESMHGSVEDNFEVIGNIYEHPELLEDS